MCSRNAWHAKQEKTWEPHIKVGYYIGNSWEHYKCHKVWIVDTQNVQVGQTCFFKHKYLTQPTDTISDAILRESDDLCQILRGIIPVKGATQSAVDQLMETFKKKSKKEETNVEFQRANMPEVAAAQVENIDGNVNGIWMNPGKAELVDDDLRTTK